jgi:hypothetical protein
MSQVTSKEEYIIEEGTRSEIQRILNQWKHQYTLKVLHFTNSGFRELGNDAKSKLYTVMIIRTRKDD